MKVAPTTWSTKGFVAPMSFRRVSPLTVMLLLSAMLYTGLLFRRVLLSRSVHHKHKQGEDDSDSSFFQFLSAFSSVNDQKIEWTKTMMDAEQIEGQGNVEREQTVEDLVPLYVITPTFPRPVQLAELTRLSQTLMNIGNMVWIVVEDAHKHTKQVSELLERIKPVVPNQHLLGPMPEIYRRTKDEYHLPKGVSNRNRGLEWILKNAKDEGVVYFADDDNTYDLRLFWEIRKTRKISVFPVGLVSGSPVSTPIIENGVITGFYVGWDGNRKFPVDMAGFAFGVKHFKELSSMKKITMPYIRGYEEDGFVKQLVSSRVDLEVLVPDKILVWHTRTSTMAFKPFKKISKKEYTSTNMGVLNSYWCMYVGNYRCDDDSKANNPPANTNNQKPNPKKAGVGFKIV